MHRRSMWPVYRLLILCVVATCVKFQAMAAATSENNTLQWTQHCQQALAHHQAKEWAQALEDWKAALALRPADSSVLYNMACTEALMGEKAEAVACLRRAAEAGLLNFAQLGRDPDLAGVRTEAEF